MKKDALSLKRKRESSGLYSERDSKRSSKTASIQRTVSLQYQEYHMNCKERIRCLGKGCAIIALVSYLFYHSVIAFLVMLPYLYFYLKKEKECLRRKRQETLRCEFKEGIQALQAALDAGYSVENAFVEACKDLKMLYPEGSYITAEFARIVQGIRMNKVVGELLDDFGERSGIEEIQNFAEIFNIAKRSGGDLILIIHSTVHTIQEKLLVKEEIATLMSGKRFEQKIMNVIPFGILFYVKMTSGEMLDVLYGNLLGIGIMTVCLGVYLFAVWLAEHIMKVEM